jgi:cell division protein FtsB
MQKDPSPRPRPAPAHSRHRVVRRPMGRTARTAAWVAGGVTIVVVLFVFVFPTRTYLDQHRQLSLAAERLHVLDAQNQQLAAEAAKLQTPAEIQRLARAQYHMVRPGERASVILPPPIPTTTTSPAPAVTPSHGAAWWRLVTSWLP